jgi:hypothetical protein
VKKKMHEWLAQHAFGKLNSYPISLTPPSSPFKKKPFFLKVFLIPAFRIVIDVIFNRLYDHSHSLNFEANLKYPTSCLGGGGAQFTNKLKACF